MALAPVRAPRFIVPPHAHVTDAQSRPTGRVKFWDLGPPEPGPAPVTAQTLIEDHPLVKASGKLNLSAVQLKELVKLFPAPKAEETPEYAEWRKAKTEYDAWMAKHGGPMQHNEWAPIAQDALSRDSKRYVWNLPKGMEPGSGNVERERREAAARAEHGPDPLYGHQDDQETMQ